MDSSSIVGRVACHVDALGGRVGCEVLRSFADGRVEVKGKGAAVGQRWLCQPEALELIPSEWVKRNPSAYL